MNLMLYIVIPLKKKKRVNSNCSFKTIEKDENRRKKDQAYLKVGSKERRSCSGG
jgi:hypothetical protein